MFIDKGCIVLFSSLFLSQFFLHLFTWISKYAAAVPCPWCWKDSVFNFSLNFTAVSFKMILANQNWLRGN